jgi:hypothetical protein
MFQRVKSRTTRLDYDPAHGNFLRSIWQQRITVVGNTVAIGCWASLRRTIPVRNSSSSPETPVRLHTLKFTLLVAVAFVLGGCSSGGGGGSAPDKTISVSIEGGQSTVAPAGSFNLAATVMNDTAGQGVTWSSTDGGLSAETSTTARYTAPGTVPENPTVTVTATSVADTSATAKVTFTITRPPESACEAQPARRGNESALTTPVAFLIKAGPSEGSSSYVYVGSFTGDGTGKITAGAMDVDYLAYGAYELTVDTETSSYSYGADGRGCLYLAFLADASAKEHPAAAHHLSGAGGVNALTRSFAHAQKGSIGKTRDAARSASAVEDSSASVIAFVMSSPTGAGRVVEFDYDGTEAGGGMAVGLMHGQTATDFSFSRFASNYAFGLDGWATDGSGASGRAAVAGSFPIDAQGNWGFGTDDYNIDGTLSGKQDKSDGNLNTAIDAATGRGTGFFETGGPGTQLQVHFVFYVVNGSDLFMMSTDDPSDSALLLSGRALKSAATSVALNGYYMFGFTGRDCTGCSNSTGNNAVAIGTLRATTALTASGDIYANDAGDFETAPYSGTYSLDTASGRAELTAVPGSPVAYLTATGQDDDIAGFLVGTDHFASAGFIAAQTTSTPAFTNASFAGNYAFGSSEDVAGTTGGEAGQYVLDGKGGYTGEVDQAFFDSGLSSGAVSGMYVVNPDGSGSFDDGQVALVTSGNLTLAIDGSSDQPLLYVFIAQPGDAANAKQPAAQAVAPTTTKSWANHKKKAPNPKNVRR